ncbi:DUF1381 domain-containing protein, partial [Staphylococcus saprophyticus]
MTHYLITTLTHSTPHPFTHLTKPPHNQTFTFLHPHTNQHPKTLYTPIQLKNA